mmetsp:Transcript_25537/g.52786  ORF Transcript_25537/g.52786 Transcript_25537/m.52786 type:complete len:119 (-) Transcript_25537:312-668(-)
MYCAPSKLANKPIRLRVTPTLMTRLSRFADSTRDGDRRMNLRDRRRPPQVQMMDMIDVTIPAPGKMNLLATLENSKGDTACISITFLAKTNVTELITVKITCDHQDSQLAPLNLVDAL